VIHSKILHGMASFVRRRRPHLQAVFRRLAHDQHPVALLLTCSDSRIVSSLLLGTHPGDLFEVRTVGNLIAPAGAGGGSSTGDASEAAAIEYALLALDVRHIMVLGHSGCGAMKAVLKQSVPEGAHNLERWVVHAHPARGRLEGSAFIDPGLPPEDRLSQANVLQQLDHIRSYALVAERLRRGEVELHGGWFDVERADLHAYSAAEGRFIRVDERVIARALAQRAAVSS
jgi:carbonic anhydrase